MNESDPPLRDLTPGLVELREAIAELAAHTQRLARAVETSNKRDPDSSPPFRYADRTLVRQPEIQMPSIHAAQPPPTRSMFDKIREKRLTLPVATGWGVLAWLAIEIGQAFIAGRIKLW